MRRVRVRLKRAQQEYDIQIGPGVLANLGVLARQVLPTSARRVAVISNKQVFTHYGAHAIASLRAKGASDFTVAHLLIGDGERYKSLHTAAQALGFLSEMKFERSDAVIALGGGVVGDLAGFAAALYLRGIAFLQVPTTLLAQVDASVGGKTGVNTAAGKNLVGAFHQPSAVLIDTDTLQTLPPRELTAGWCEALKQGAAGDIKLFEQTRRFLAQQGTKPDASSAEQITRLIAEQCAFKAAIVASDEREDIGRTDQRSRRILNFGHTTAHALEAVTHYKRFRHGEAVGYGMLAAGEISVKLGLLDKAELEGLRNAISLAGRLPRADDLNEAEVLSAVAADKKSVGGHVKWVLLERLGQARIVDGRKVPARIVRSALHAALQQDSRCKQVRRR